MPDRSTPLSRRANGRAAQPQSSSLPCPCSPGDSKQPASVRKSKCSSAQRSQRPGTEHPLSSSEVMLGSCCRVGHRLGEAVERHSKLLAAGRLRTKQGGGVVRGSGVQLCMLETHTWLHEKRPGEVVGMKVCVQDVQLRMFHNQSGTSVWICVCSWARAAVFPRPCCRSGNTGFHRFCVRGCGCVVVGDSRPVRLWACFQIS